MSGDPSQDGGSGVDGAKGRTAAFFDLDKTIIAKAAMSAFRGPLYDGGLLNRRSVARALLAQLIYLHLGASEARLERLRGSVLRLAVGWERTEVRAIVEEALERIVEPIIYAEAMDLIERHRTEGRLIVIVSASPEEIVGPLGRHLGADETISSAAAIDSEGRYNGKMAFYAYGQDKADAIREFAVENSIDLESSYAYSDSNSDLPMLECVGHPAVVNGDRALVRLAKDRGWETLSFVRPVRLRDRVRGRFETPRPTLAISAAGVAGVVAVAAIGWWALVRRRARNFETDSTRYI